MARLAPTVEMLLPRLREHARAWTQSQNDADNIVCLALEMAIDSVERAPQEIESWLFTILDPAHDEYLERQKILPCKIDSFDRSVVEHHSRKN